MVPVNLVMTDKQDPTVPVTPAMTDDKVGRTVAVASVMTDDHRFGHGSTVTMSASEGEGWRGSEGMSWNQVGDGGRGDCKRGDEQESPRVRQFIFLASTTTRTQRTNQARSEPSPAPSEGWGSEFGYSGHNSPPPCRSLQGASNSFRD
jgi:hypothetical protein